MIQTIVVKNLPPEPVESFKLEHDNLLIARAVELFTYEHLSPEANIKITAVHVVEENSVVIEYFLIPRL